jgi:hypothetical protein
MAENDDDLRTTAEDIAAKADRLRRIEEQKLQLPDGDPAQLALSEEAAQLTEELAAGARVQLDIAQEEAGRDD